MTPLQIQIALVYHATSSDFRDGDFSVPAVRQAIEDFLTYGLLKLNINRQLDNEPVYVGTERLDVYCEKLKSIELPTQMWGYEK
jgi:hypothetical protein